MRGCRTLNPALQVPAACCGVYCYRPTTGVLPLEGVSVASPSLAAPALLARDPSVLLRAGEALQLPGGARPRGLLSGAWVRCLCFMRLAMGSCWSSLLSFRRCTSQHQAFTCLG